MRPSRYDPRPRVDIYGERPHEVTVRKSPLGHHLACTCGWGQFIKRQNALARAAKVRGALTKHFASIEPSRDDVFDDGHGGVG